MPVSPCREIPGCLRCQRVSLSSIKPDLSMHHRRTGQNLKPLNFQSQNSSEAFINSLYLCTFGLIEECQAREWLHCSLLHERAAQFSINLTSDALKLNDFDIKTGGGCRISQHCEGVISQVEGSQTKNNTSLRLCSARGHLGRGT